MPGPPTTPEEWEITRRSVAMLSPRHPAGLDREAALALFDELQRLRRVNRHLGELCTQLRARLAAADIAANRPSELR